MKTAIIRFIVVNYDESQLTGVDDSLTKNCNRPSVCVSGRQVLKAKVLQCDPDKSKMLLSFKAAMEGESEAAAAAQSDCEVGTVSQ